jgi:hypothetical protein
MSRTGISLHRLPILLGDIQLFLDLLVEDAHAGEVSDWIGLDFRGAEVSYTATTAEVVGDDKAVDFYRMFRSVVKNAPDIRVRYETLAQYLKIAEPLELNERVEFGLDTEEAKDDLEAIISGSAKVSHAPTVEWLQLTRTSAAAAAPIHEAQALVKAYGAVQGIVHSLFIGSRPPHFQLRELSTGNLVKCVYEDAQYNDIVAALETKNAVLHVFGLTRTDLVNRKLIDLRVDKIQVSRRLTLEDLDAFIGSAPDLLGDTPLQTFLDRSRGRA